MNTLILLLFCLGALVLLALLFFTPYFYFIPKAALAAIIIAAVVFMVEIKVVKPMWRSKSNFLLILNAMIALLIQLLIYISESDLIPGIGTFIACLALPLEIGILFGIGLNMVFILYHAARPKISVETLTVIKKPYCLEKYLFVFNLDSFFFLDTRWC